MAIGSHGRGRGGTVGDGRLAIGRRRGKALFVFVRGLSELLLQSTGGTGTRSYIAIMIAINLGILFNIDKVGFLFNIDCIFDEMAVRV